MLTVRIDFSQMCVSASADVTTGAVGPLVYYAHLTLVYCALVAVFRSIWSFNDQSAG